MSILNPTILFGLGLVALPVILHLLLKQKPKKLLFPALKLIADRKKQNVSRMRLRHLWLLLLRMAVIGLIVFAVARPSVPAADFSLNVREGLTIAGVIGLAVAANVFLSRRWKRAGVPRHERRFRESKLRSGLIGGALALLLLTVAWPYQRRIAAELKAPAPAGDVSLPVAAVFLFDGSLSMQYQQQGKTRLDVAKELALQHLSDLAVGSRIAVADVASDNPILFQTTIAGAKTRIESLEIESLALPLNDRIRAALRLHEDDRTRTLADQSGLAEAERKDRYLRRVYVMTDVARSAFRTGGQSRLADELESQPNVNLFLVDVGDAAPQNVAIADVKPSRIRLSDDETFHVQATVSRLGDGRGETSPADESIVTESEGPTTVVELLLRDSRGKPIKVDQQSIEWGDEGPQVLSFGPLKPEFGPVVHGDVRLVSSDPLPFDDARSFTVEVRPAASVLVVSPTTAEATEWSVALEIQGFEVTQSPPNELGGLTLTDYAAVCLINVLSLPDNSWYRLGQYVEQGGGLAVFLGDTRIEQVNYNRDEAQVFLPAKLDVWSAPGVSYFRIPNDQHPMFRALAEDDGIALLEITDVDRFWRVVPAADALVMARYSEALEAPALVERVHGRGRTVMMTTAVDVKGFGKEWTYLPSPQGPAWTFVAFADEMIRYLSRESERRLTYEAGETPVLHFAAAEENRSFLLQHPEYRQSRVSLPAGETQLTFPETKDLGHYDLKTQKERSQIVSGFSVNAVPEESDFTQIEANELDELFGEQRYQLVRSIGELEESINIADLGRELFPVILAFLALFFVGEHFVANWFYDDEQADDSRSRWTTPQPQSTSVPSPTGTSVS